MSTTHRDGFSFLQKQIPPGSPIAENDHELDDETRRERIRCPRCTWEPTPDSRWWCSDCDWPENFIGGCNTAWHTFDTGGVCPGCGHLWQWTMCLRCMGWSKHEDWYERE